MPKRLALAGLLAVSLGAGGCLQNPTMTAIVRDYVPLAVGNTWCYYKVWNIGGFNFTGYERWTVQNAETKDGKPAYNVRVKAADSACNESGSGSSVYWFDSDGELQRNVTYSDCKWLTMFKYPPIENTEWKLTCVNGLATETFVWKTRGRETLTLAISSTQYVNCGKVVETHTTTLGSVSVTSETTVWFAPGVGLVKQEIVDRTPGSTTYNTTVLKYELASHNVAK